MDHLEGFYVEILFPRACEKLTTLARDCGTLQFSLSEALKLKGWGFRCFSFHGCYACPHLIRVSHVMLFPLRSGNRILTQNNLNDGEIRTVDPSELSRACLKLGCCK